MPWSGVRVVLWPRPGHQAAAAALSRRGGRPVLLLHSRSPRAPVRREQAGRALGLVGAAGS